MQHSSVFSEGTTFYADGSHYIVSSIAHKQTDNELYCKLFNIDTKKPEKTRQVEFFYERELKRQLCQGNAKLIDGNESSCSSMLLSDRQIELQEMWMTFNEEHWERNNGKDLQSPRLVEEAITLFPWHLYNYSKPCISNCQEKISKYTKSEKDPRSQVNWRGVSDKGGCRLSEVTQLVILQFITEFYFVRKDQKAYSQNKIIDLILDELKMLKANFPEKNYEIPCKQTLYNFIGRYDKLSIAENQLSKQEIKKLKKQLRRSLVGEYPLERVEMDAVYVSIGLLDDDGTTFLGTVVLMVAIDTYTRTLVGYAMHVDKDAAESGDLAVECVKNIVSEKENPELPHGKPRTIISDGSTANIGYAYKQCALDLGIRPIVVRSNEPWAKPFIERFFLTLRVEFLSELAGYMGSKLFRNQRHLNPMDDVEKHATLTVSEFKEKLEDFIVNYYHMSGHKGLNFSAPIDVWNGEIRKNPLLVGPDLSTKTPFFRGLHHESRRLYEDGYVVLGDEQYVADALKKLSLQGVELVQMYYSNIDRSSVVVKSDNVIVVAHRRNKPYIPLNEFKASVDAARKNYLSEYEKKPKKRYPPGKGLADLKSNKNKNSSTSKFDNDKLVDITCDDAEARMSEGTEVWVDKNSKGNDRDPIQESPSDTQSPQINIKSGEVL